MHPTCIPSQWILKGNQQCISPDKVRGKGSASLKAKRSVQVFVSSALPAGGLFSHGVSHRVSHRVSHSRCGKCKQAGMLHGPDSGPKRTKQAADQDALTDTKGEMRHLRASTYRVQTELPHKTSDPFPAILPPPIYYMLPATHHQLQPAVPPVSVTATHRLNTTTLATAQPGTGITLNFLHSSKLIFMQAQGEIAGP